MAETSKNENTMKAVIYNSYSGGAEGLKVVDLPIPTPKRDEVLVKVEAASICPVDWKIKEGHMKPVLPFRFPHTPGADIAGEVVCVGPGVSTFVKGDKVLSCTGRAGGGLAEYAIAPLGTTVKRPHCVSAADGVALGVSGFAALQSVKNSAGIALTGSKQKTKNLLITAASGGVGTIAVQLAKLGGAHVTVTCGAQNFELLKSLGADEFLDYKTPQGAALESPSGIKYDVVINCAPNQPFRNYKPQLAPAGFVIDMNPSPKGFFTSALHVASFSKQKYYPFMHIPNCEDMYFLFNLIRTKKLKPVIDSTFPLARIEEAWTKCREGHAVGKIVISCFEKSTSQSLRT